jgi:hypothetical protein
MITGDTKQGGLSNHWNEHILCGETSLVADFGAWDACNFEMDVFLYLIT